MSDVRGVADVLRTVVADLRDHDPLVDLLPGPDAVYQGRPSDDPDHPVALVITPVYDGSTPHRGAVTRNYRIQATVVSTAGWRQDQVNEAGTNALATMYEVLDHVADVLDRDAASGPEVSRGGTGGPVPESIPRTEPSGRLYVMSDWKMRGTYATDE